MKQEKTEEELTKEKQKSYLKRVLGGWNACMKNAFLYTDTHPSVHQACQNLVSVLEEIFKNKFEVHISHQNGIFLVDNDLFIEESILMFDLIQSLEDTKIQSVNFLTGITKEEVIKLTSFLYHKIRERKTENFRPEPFSSQHVHVFLESFENEVLEDKRGARVRKAFRIYEDWTALTEKTFERLVDEQVVLISELTTALDKLIDAIQLDPESFTTVLSAPVKNLNAQHAVNTMILSLYIGQKLILDTNTLKILAISALLHDIGRLLIPSQYGSGDILKQGDDEFIRLHPQEGASFLAGVSGLPITVLRVALEHHMGYDRKGYPALPSSFSPHFFSEIVGLADFISWGTVSNNYYHKPVPLHRRIRAVLRRTGTQFNPLFVKIIIPILGIYPTGTKVLLKNGENTVCIESNVRNIIRPAVAFAENGDEADYFTLTKLNKNEENFITEIDTIQGVHTDMEPYYSLIPNRSDMLS